MPLYWGTQKIGEVHTENHEHIWVDINSIYPIGSVYISVTSSNPSELFGGTWERIKDTFLLAAGDTYTAGTTGGSATKNLQHAHTTAGHTLTANEIPAHSHVFGYTILKYMNGNTGYAFTGGWLGGTDCQWTSHKNPSTNNTGGGGSHNHGNTGNGLTTTQDIMPPYLTVYIWKRIA